MINAEFFIKNSRFSGFRISGHAGYSDSGSDIVCASVSSAVQLTANTVTDFFGISANVSAEGETVILETSGSENSKEVNLLISSLKAHLDLISEEFPGTLNITTTEV
jgi:uncharacterized protein YsxB (DUF464 family)